MKVVYHCRKICLTEMLQPLGEHCGECAIHHEQDVCEEQHPIYLARTSNNRVITARDLYCCLLPQYKASHTCRSGLPIATETPTSFNTL